MPMPITCTDFIDCTNIAVTRIDAGAVELVVTHQGDGESKIAFFGKLPPRVSRVLALLATRDNSNLNRKLTLSDVMLILDVLILAPVNSLTPEQNKHIETLLQKFVVTLEI